MFQIYKTHLKGYRKEIILGPLLKMLEAIFELLVPLIMAQMIDRFQAGSLGSSIYLFASLLFVFAILGFTSTMFCQYMAAKASVGFGTSLRDALFLHIVNFSFYEFDHFKKNVLLTRLNNDVTQLQLSVSMFIRQIVRAPLLILGAICLAGFISLWAMLFFFLVALLCFFFIYLISHYTIKKNHALLKDTEDISFVVKEDFKGAKTIRGFNTYQLEEERFATANTAYLKDFRSLNVISALLNPLMTLIISCSVVSLLFFFGYNYHYSFGELQALISYLTQILAAILAMSNLIKIFSRSFASLKRINEVFATKPEFQEGRLDHYYNVDKPLFTFNHVSFSYNDQDEILTDVSFEINKSELIAFIGETGSGKSTIIKLLKRFYDPTSGNISFYGTDLKDYTFDFLAKEIALVPQITLLEKGDVLHNLAWGDQEIDPEYARLALENSCFNLKLDSEIVEGGRNLSGGEKQRMSLARALASRSDVIILDDSLSALDFKTDSKIRANLKKLNKTLIVVTERISSIKEFDKIFVLDDGQIKAVGRHEELLHTSPLYKELYDLQTSGER